MEERAAHVPDHPKKRRRKPGSRRQLRSKEPISARLVLDHQLRGDTGLLSEDLVADLFPRLNPDGENFRVSLSPCLCPRTSLSNAATAYTR